MTNVIEEFFQFDVIEMLFLPKLALLEDTPQCLSHLMAHIDDAFSFHEYDGLSLNDTQVSRDANDFFAALKELFRLLCLLHSSV